MEQIIDWLDWLPFVTRAELATAAQVLLAAVLGGIIGVEREFAGRSAGIRTNMIIALASCLFTILSIQGFPLVGAAQDTARVAAQVVSGVGFIGAGTLIYRKDKVRGLTTAATIWLVAAVGMAVGAGIYFLAVFSSLLAMLILQGLRPVKIRVSRMGHTSGES